MLPPDRFPPPELVQAKLWFIVLPTAVATALVFVVGLLVAWALRSRFPGWRRVAPGLAVLALTAGIAASPLLNAWVNQRVTVAKAAGDAETATKLAERYQFEAPFPWVPDGKWWHWGWYAIGLALAVELIARLPVVGGSVGYLLRGTAAGVIAAAVVPPDWQKPETRWWLPLAAFGMAAQWAVVEAVARRNPGGSIAVALAVVSLGASAVFIHDDSAGFTDTATFLFMGLSVLALLAWLTRTDVGAAAAAAVAPLASLLMMNHALRTSDPQVPTACYWLVGLAPLALVVFLLPPLKVIGTRWYGTPLRVLTVAIPVAVAVYRCVTETPLTFGEKW